MSPLLFAGLLHEHQNSDIHSEQIRPEIKSAESKSINQIFDQNSQCAVQMTDATCTITPR